MKSFFGTLLFTVFLRLSSLWAQPNIIQAEYFFDTDPGFGNGVAISVTPSPNLTLSFTPSIAALADGFHNLYVRGKDANGNWSGVQVRSFFKSATSGAPTISSFNPSSGLVGSTVVITGTNFSTVPANNTVRFNGVPATVTNATSNSLTVTVPAGATSGLISVVVNWLTATNSSAFTVLSPNLTYLEYFFNTDPGPGNGTAIVITPGNNIDLTNINIATTGLPIGWHTLCVRAKDANNVWGFYEARQIFVRGPADAVTPSPAADVTQVEFFYDNDTGPGNGTAIPVTAGATVDIVNTNLANTLSQGWHTVSVRARNANNVWGFYETRQIYVREPGSGGTPPPEPITAMEFFYDTDTGPGTGTSIPVTSGLNVDLTNIDLANTLPLGWHTVSVRAKNNANVWGFYESRQIFIRGLADVAPPISPMVEMEWFVDADPGPGQSSTKKTISPSQTNIDLVDEPLDVGTQTLGAHKIYIRAKNQDGAWSMSEARDFSVTAPCTILTPPTANNATRCSTGTLTLTASGATGGQTYRWYADNTTLTALLQGNPFITPSLSVNTSYFVSVYDPVTFCESTRTQVTAIVTGIPKPALNLTGSLAVCAGSSVTLTAPEGYTVYTWSNGLTTQSITLTASGVYTVTVGDGTCTSPSSDPFTFTVNPLPLKPTITGTNGGSLCGTGSVTLSAPAGFSSYAWSSGQTTQNITVSTAGNFTVQVANASGCQSPPADAYSVTTTPPAKPTVGITGNTALCGGSTVTLSAPAGFTSYTWSNGSTSQNIIVNAAGSYSVIAANGSCVSPSSDPVVVTSVAIPPQPTITITGNNALCIGSFAVLTATTAPVYLWSTGETTQQIVVSTAGSYTVQVGNTSNCLSVASNATAISLTGIACPGAIPTPTITGGSTCGAGSVTLTATGATGSQVYRWYNVPTGGSVLFTGANFSTPVISASTNYYASIFDPAVPGEGSRSMGTASVATFSTPSISPSGPVSICAGSSTVLSAPGGFTNYLWSNGATTQQISVSVAGSYSVQTGSSTCLSASSANVVVTISPALTKPVVTITGNTVFCGSGSVQLAAPTGFSSYAWSNGATTQSITVTTTGNYSVAVSNGICTSPSSDDLAVTSVAVPPQPSVSVTGSTALCNGAFAVLSAPSGFNNYLWSTGETTRQIVVNLAGSYAVQAGQAANCLSVASTPTSITLTGAPCGGGPTPPGAPIVANVSRCGSGSVTLSATGATGTQVYRWYDAAVSGNLLFTGASFSTFVTTTTNFYAVIFDSTTGEGTPAQATATVVTIATPTIVGPSAISICAGNTATLSAPVGFVQYVWSTGATTQQLSVTTAGSYSVRVGDGTCLSNSSNSIVVTVSPVLSKPTISVIGNPTICGSGSVILMAPTGFSSYSWSTGATTQSITATASDSYSVTVSNGTCTSPVSDGVSVTVVAVPAKPTIGVTGSTSLCNGAFVVLTAPPGFANYRWSTLETTQQIIVNSARSVMLQTGNSATCLSPVSDPVPVTLTGQPCGTVVAPLPPSVSNAARCGVGAVTLTATGAATNQLYRWYADATTTNILSTGSTYTVSPSGNTSYFVSVYDPGSLLESTRAVATVTIFQVPSKPQVNAQGREFLCGGAVVALSAPSGFTVYRWSTGSADDNKQTILVEAAGKYTVRVGQSTTCLSQASDEYAVKIGTPQQCGVVVTPASKAPVIATKVFAVQIQSAEAYEIKNLIIDANDNQDLSTLRIIDQPNTNGKPSGGIATLDADYNLVLDYRGVNFAGKESITIQVCDTEGLCTQQQMGVDVVGDVVVFNGVSPDGDGFNDFMRIQFIDVLEGAKENKVVVLNRWGEVVFSIDNYDNQSRVFTGNSNTGSELPPGTYLYKVDLSSGKRYTGFITLKK